MSNRDENGGSEFSYSAKQKDAMLHAAELLSGMDLVYDGKLSIEELTKLTNASLAEHGDYLMLLLLTQLHGLLSEKAELLDEEGVTARTLIDDLVAFSTGVNAE